MALVVYFAYKNLKNNRDFFEVFIRHNRLQKRKTKMKYTSVRIFYVS